MPVFLSYLVARTFFLTVGLLQLAEQYNVQIILTDLSPAIRHVLNIEGLDLVRALAISPEFMQMRENQNLVSPKWRPDMLSDKPAGERIPGYCALCISRCGSIAVVDNGRFTALEPDPSHPTGQALCAKGRAAPELVYHPEDKCCHRYSWRRCRQFGF
jgi:hypothetical protein